MVPSQVQSLRSDLTDIPWPDAEVVYFTDGGSFTQDGTRYAGAAVLTFNSLRWASALPPETLTQWAKLIVLTQALKMAQGMIANIFMHSWYAFTTTNAHRLVYKKRGLFRAKGKTIKKHG